MRSLLRKRIIAWMIVLAMAALLFSGCGKAKETPAVPTETPAAAETPAQTAPAVTATQTPTAAPSPSATPVPSPPATAAPAPSPTPTPAPTPTPLPTPAPDPAVMPVPSPPPTEPPPPDLMPTPSPTPPPAETPVPSKRPSSASDLKPKPATGTDLKPVEPVGAVDDSFFADAAFVGNSLMDGLHLFGGLQYGDFYSGTSASVISAATVTDFKNSVGAPSTMLNALLEKQYNKIFLLFGVNELGFYVNVFIDIYTDLLAQIAAGEPNAKLYILSLTPVTMGRSTSSDVFTRERVETFNAEIRAMAEREGYVYMDLYTPMADANGWLPEYESTDGVHFSASKYSQWADFLRSFPY